MVRDLKNYQSQVNAYKFEIERLDKEVAGIKQLYFNSKEQVLNQDEEQAMDQQMQMQQEQAMQEYANDLQMQAQAQGQQPG